MKLVFLLIFLPLAARADEVFRQQHQELVKCATAIRLANIDSAGLVAVFGEEDRGTVYKYSLCSGTPCAQVCVLKNCTTNNTLTALAPLRSHLRNLFEAVERGDKHKWATLKARNLGLDKLIENFEACRAVNGLETAFEKAHDALTNAQQTEKGMPGEAAAARARATLKRSKLVPE